MLMNVRRKVKVAVPVAMIMLITLFAGVAFAETAEESWDTVASDMVQLIIGIVGDVVDLFINNPILMLGLGIAIFGIVANFIRRVIPGA